MKHNRSKNAMLLMIIFICSICLNNVWARETGTMDLLMATLDGNTKTLLPVSELPCILSLIQ